MNAAGGRTKVIRPTPAPGWPKALLLTAAGVLINLLALTAPGATPLMLGNASAYALALRQPPWLALGAAIILGAAAGGWTWAALGLSATALVWLADRLRWGRVAAVLLPAVPAMLWPLWLYLDGYGSEQALSAAAVLLLGHIAASLAARQLFDLARAGHQRETLGLADQLASRLAIGTAAPLCVLLLAIGQLVWREGAEDQQGRVASLGRDLLHDVERFLEARQASIGYAADETRLPAQLPDLAALSSRFPGFLTLLVSDADGQIVHYHAPGMTQFAGNVADRSYFSEPKRNGRLYISDVFRGRGFGSDMLVAISAPHRDAAGQFAGVVQGSLSLQQLSQRLASEADAQQLDFALADNAGQVLATSLSLAAGAPIAEHPALGERVTMRGLTTDRRGQWIVDRAQIETPHWQVWALRDLGPLRRDADWTNAGIALSCIVLLLLMSRLAHRFVRPQLAPLGALLARMRAVDLMQPATLQDLTTPAESREYRDLRDDFNAMLGRLAELYRELQAAVERGDRLNRELEQRVLERTTALADALQRAERLAEAKSVFLANMSHELRTPLTAILGYAERALAAPDSPQTRQTALRTIDRNGRHLLGVLNDILDASRLDAGHLPMEAVEVSPWALAEDVHALFAEQARERGLRLNLDARWPLPATLVLDPLRLRQVLLNLVGNAIKFTERGEVSVELLAEGRETLVIAVTDSGIGMSAEASARLFRAFEQADVSTTRRFGGSGLGLYISHALVKRMGGRIGVHSEPGRGSRFEVRLPIPADARWIDAPEAASRPAAKLVDIPRLRGRVLVAEDVEDLRLLIASLVEDTGARTLMAADGASAVTLALFEAPDLVLLDMHMPVMDGVEAARRLRAEGFTRPIIALTADVLPGDVARYREAGCDRVLAKPVDRAALLAALRDTLPAAEPAQAPAQERPAADRRANLEALMQKARVRFAEALHTEIPAIREADPHADATPLRHRLHTLKGSAGTFGFAELGSLAGRAEQELISGAVDWAAHRDALLTAMQRAIDAVESVGGTAT